LVLNPSDENRKNFALLLLTLFTLGSRGVQMFLNDRKSAAENLLGHPAAV
jgi:hypothetical protein